MPESCGQIEVVENPPNRGGAGGSGLLWLLLLLALLGAYLRHRGDL